MMTIYQQTLLRTLSIFIGFGSLILFFMFLIYKILKKGKKRLTLTFSGFYIFACIGLILNFIYASVFNVALVIVLHYITMFCVFFSLTFLLNFCILLHRGEEKFKLNMQIIIILIYGILLSLKFFIPNGVTFNLNWRPVWNIYYFIYVITIITIFAVIPTLYYAIKIFYKFDNKIIKKKWIYFIIGMIMLFIAIYGSAIDNFLDNALFRPIWSVFLTILTFTGALLIYMGVSVKF